MRSFLIGWVAFLAIGEVAYSGTKELPKKLSIDLGAGVRMEMVLIPPGEFLMGSSESEEEIAGFFREKYGQGDVYLSERPKHRVRITKPFYLGTYHVTRGQFRQFVKDSAYETDAEKAAKVAKVGVLGDSRYKQQLDMNEKYTWRHAGFEQTDDHPVVSVSWNDAMAFCKWLSKKEGKTFRLPTEAEWEYACRAGTTTRYYSGDDPETLAKVGNVADGTFNSKFPRADTIKAKDRYVFTAPVGKFRPNAFGLYDMHGNAWQWCADSYSDDYYGKSPADDPTGPASGLARMLRGGSLASQPSECRSANRLLFLPDWWASDIGFRVARAQR